MWNKKGWVTSVFGCLKFGKRKEKCARVVSYVLNLDMAEKIPKGVGELVEI